MIQLVSLCYLHVRSCHGISQQACPSNARSTASARSWIAPKQTAIHVILPSRRDPPSACCLTVTARQRTARSDAAGASAAPC